MAYQELSTGQVDANSPLDTTLFQQIRTNQIDFNGRLSGQTVYTQSNATVTSTVIIPRDNTKPAVTEGVEILTAVITPLSSSDKMLIEAIINIGGAAQGGAIALFQDSATAAIHTTEIPQLAGGGGEGFGVSLKHIVDTIGTTAASTFALRVGPSTSGAVSINQDVGANLYDGTLYSNMTITEIATT